MELLNKAGEWLTKAFERDDFDANRFKGVAQLFVALGKNADLTTLKSFTVENCAEGLNAMLGKDAE